ncbi:MAG: HemK/PrmC family methyltransferase [Bdellovibrionales bacterium]
MTFVISEIAKDYEQRFTRAGILKPQQEVYYILKKILGDKTEIDRECRDALERALNLREQRMPIERIFGVTDFCGLSLHTAEDVYKPYPETEDLVHYALSTLGDERKNIRILDLGTGTGCILLSLLKALPESSGVGIDLNEKALDVARENARENQLFDRAEFKIGNWSEDLTEKFDLVISNPPRAPTEFIPNLLPEMRNYDPPISLDGGADGLDFIRKVAADFDRLSQSKALCLCQLGAIYASEVVQIFEKAGFSDVRVMGNYAGEPCCLVVKKGFSVSPFQWVNDHIWKRFFG